MTRTSILWTAVGLAALALTGCKTTDGSGVNSASTVKASAPSQSTGMAMPSSGSTGPVGATGSGIPALVSVNLQNVLNNLSVSLNVSRNNIPLNAQVPISVAASVCGVSVDVLAASAANGHATCTATTTTPHLTQAVQQQIASGGNVNGGAQTMSPH